MKINYSLSNDTWDNKEIEAINRVIASNHFTMGKEVEKYEKLDDFYNVWINNKKLFVSKRNLVNNKYSYDATDIFLKLNKGDIVLGAFIGKTYSFVIKDNTCGLTYTANLEVF